MKNKNKKNDVKTFISLVDFCLKTQKDINEQQIDINNIIETALSSHDMRLKRLEDMLLPIAEALISDTTYDTTCLSSQDSIDLSAYSNNPRFII